MVPGMGALVSTDNLLKEAILRSYVDVLKLGVGPGGQCFNEPSS